MVIESEADLELWVRLESVGPAGEFARVPLVANAGKPAVRTALVLGAAGARVALDVRNPDTANQDLHLRIVRIRVGSQKCRK